MPTFEYRCLDCGTSHDQFRAVSQRNAPYTCPDCGAEHRELEQVPEGSDREARLLARVLTATSPDQFLVPGHFGHTVHTTGLKTELGSGEWENTRRRMRRWDSGANAPSRTRKDPRVKAAMQGKRRR